MNEPANRRSFWQRYRRHILVSLLVYLLLTAVLILFSGGPQKQPFVYQIF